MIRFILRRVAFIPVALVLVHCLGFAYAHFAGPIRAARNPFFASRADPSPFLPTYESYMRNALHLEFGTVPTGAAAQESIVSVIAEASAASLGLTATAWLLSVVLGLFIGLRAVRTDPPQVSNWLTIFSTVGLAMPSFYIGSLFVFGLLAYVLRGGYGTQLPLPMRGFGWDEHLVLPALALMARPTVQIAHVTAELLVEELDKQYVFAARSFGHTWHAILGQKALRNILASVILSVAGSARLLVGELIVIEWLFVWPGLGRLLALALIPAGTSSPSQAPLFLNPPLVAAVLLVFAGVFLVTDLVAAALVRAVDPRLRAAEEERPYV